jgi:hypothetical protein
LEGGGVDEIQRLTSVNCLVQAPEDACRKREAAYIRRECRKREAAYIRCECRKRERQHTYAVSAGRGVVYTVGVGKEVVSIYANAGREVHTRVHEEVQEAVVYSATP